MIVLGIETATPLLGVALVDGRGVVGEYSLRRDRAHAERLLGLIDAVLGQCGVDRAAVGGVAVSAGPGSFTGLRIGMAAAKAWAFGTGAAFCAVPTLDALAHQAGALGVAGTARVAGAAAGAGTLCPVINARRGQVYYALYPVGASTAGASAAATPAAAAVPAATTPAGLLEVLAAIPGTLYLCGDGLWQDGLEDAIRRALGERLVRLDATFDLPRAGAVAALGRRRLVGGRADDPYAAAPVYVAIPAARPFGGPAPAVEAAPAAEEAPAAEGAAPGARRRGGGGGARR